MEEEKIVPLEESEGDFQEWEDEIYFNGKQKDLYS